MDFFSHFPQADLDIVSADGVLKASTKGLVDKNKITFPDVTLVVEPGDEVRRKLPNGTEEAFTVREVHFSDAWETLPASIAVDVSRKGSFPKGQGGNYTFNVSGPNARVNFASTDNSRNSVTTGSVFADLRRVIQETDGLKTRQVQLEGELQAMETAADKSAFTVAYTKFVSLAADHMSVVAPFIPALTQLLGGTHGS